MIPRRALNALPAAILVAACLPSSALAWKHIDPSPFAWLPEDMPIEYVMQEDCEDSVPEDYCLTVIEQSFDSWEAVPCIEIEAEYAGIYEGSPPGELHSFDLADLSNHYSYDDPDDVMEVGVLAATSNQRFGLAFQLNGTNYSHATNGDISFNDSIDFGTHEEIAGGQCSGQTNMRSVAVHEIGHFLGMGHSCDDGEICTDPDLRGAIMYWQADDCTTLIEPQIDDIQGITALYGPSAQFTCSHQVDDDLALGVVPFEMKCVVESRDFLQDVTHASWTFGDGGTAEGINASHTYETPGNYTVRVSVEGQSEGCGEDGWTSDFRKVGFVRACGIPEVSFAAEHVDGRQYQMLNDTNVSVYGCIQDIVWSVYEGDKVSGKPMESLSGIKAWEPIFDFEEDGTYTVVANVGGPAGTGAAKLTFDVKNRRDTGCDSVGATGLGGVGFVLGLGLLGLRRRRD